MITIRNIRITERDRHLVTSGLKKIIGFELKLLTIEKDKNQYLELLTYLVDYFVDHKPLIKDGQTIAYYSWILKFVFVDGIINLFEATPNGDEYTQGVDYAITVVNSQKHECIKYSASPLFPLFSQMIVVSKGVLEGGPVDAVRYPSPEHMTGWWLTTDLYDGDVKSLETVHYYHLAFNRPDLIKYLALPFGFRFHSGEQFEVWFDEEVLL